MTRKVIFRPTAEVDLQNLYDFIEADSPANAAGFIDRIEEFCRSLSEYPERGRRRDDLRPGIRVITLKRRVLIAFAVSADTVEIAHVVYAGRDIAAVFRSEPQ